MSILSSDDWTDDLPVAVRNRLFAAMTLERVAAGTEVHVPGMMPHGIIRIKEGHLRLSSPRRDGGRSLLCVLAPGSCLGEAAVLAQRPFNNSAVAIGPVSILRLPTRDFLSLYQEHRAIADALCRKFARAIARQGRDRARRAELRIGERVAATLSDLAHDCGLKSAQGITVSLPLTQTDLAEHLDVTRQSVQIELAALRRAGIVRKVSGRWLVTDVTHLRRLAAAH